MNLPFILFTYCLEVTKFGAFDYIGRKFQKKILLHKQPIQISGLWAFPTLPADN